MPDRSRSERDSNNNGDEYDAGDDGLDAGVWEAEGGRALHRRGCCVSGIRAERLAILQADKSNR